MTTKGRYIAKERGLVMSTRERLTKAIEEKPGAVLTALAQLPYNDCQSLKWVTRKALETLTATC